MLYDWVRIKKGMCAGCLNQLTEVHELECASNYEPIPITEEILEANGFVCRGHAGYQSIKDELCDRHLTFYINGMMFADGMPYEDNDCNVLHNIKYVHELQRALRCCNLWDIANNFKIEYQ